MKTVRKSNADRILNATRAAAFKNISDGVEAGVELSQRLCPVDKGDLLSTTNSEDDGQGHASIGTGGPSNISDEYVDHHMYIEFGTVKMPAQSFYRPGVEKAKEEIKAGMKIVAG